MISQEQQARKKEMNSFIKSLTFLELCTVPKITPTYLSLFEVKQIKHIMLLNTQTLLQWQKYPQKEINPRRNQFAQSLKQCEKKILGQQLLHLLREICCFCLTKQLPLELIILQIEPNQDHLLIANTYKAILVSLMEYSEQARMRPDYVSALISLLDLVADLNDVSIDNCRALNLQKRGEQNGFIKKLQEVQQLLVMLVSENHNLYDNFVTYGLNLIKKYRFVILEQVYKDEKRQTVNQENRVNMIEVEEQELQAHQFQTTQILDFFKLCKTLQQKQAFLVNSYYNCLKNINHLNIQTFSSLYNTISISLSEILNIDLKDQGSKNEQSIQTISSRKSNHYCLLLGLKIMLALKQPQSDLRTTIIETQSVLKELLSFKVPKIKLIYMLITTLSYVDIENGDLVDLTLVMVDFIVDFYAKKYPLKKEEYIFGVNLINYQEILKFWRKNRKSNKIQGKVLIDPIAQRLSEYQQNYIKILFEYLNPKLLDFLVKVYTTENNFFAFDSNEIKDEDKEKQKIMLVLRLFESRFTSQSNFLTDLLNGSKKQVIEDQRVKNKCNKSFEVMFDIWLQRSQQQQAPQGKAQFLIFTIIYQIYRLFKNDHIAYSRQYLVQKLIDKCKVKCYKAIISLINVQALDITIPTKKNLSQINLQNADAKIRTEIMDFLQLVLTFLHCFGFAINPIKNKMDFIHGLVVNSFVGEDKIDEILLLINEDIEIWKEMPEYQTILKYAQKYDTLELVYKYVIAKIYQQNKQRHQQSKRSFQKFCRQWCSKDEHYQWLSQQTTNRLKLLNFREYCCLYKNDQI